MRYPRRFRDGLATAGGVLRESWRLVAESAAASGAMPRGVVDVDAAWLTRVLQPSFPGARVARVDPMARAAGTTDRTRLRLTYDARGDGSEPPASVFVKLAPADRRTRLFVNLMRLGATEVGFYRELAAEVPVETPRVFHAELSGQAERFVLVLEDLVARDARFTNVAEPVTVEDAQMVVEALGRLHARFWASPRLRDRFAWLRAGRGPRYPLERFVCALAVGPVLRRFTDLVPPALRAAAPEIVAGRDRLEDAWAAGPLTLVHGDAHAGNLYFVPGAVGFLDWQVVQCGQGLRDVAYFLVTSLATALRRTHEDELLGRYLTTLSAHGVAPPPAGDARWSYRLHALYAWIATVVTAAAATLQTERIVRAGLARASAAVVDLDALGALADCRRGPPCA